MKDFYQVSLTDKSEETEIIGENLQDVNDIFVPKDALEMKTNESLHKEDITTKNVPQEDETTEESTHKEEDRRTDTLTNKEKEDQEKVIYNKEEEI